MKEFHTASLRAVPRSSFAIVLAALMLSMAILVNTFYNAQGTNHDKTYYACLYAGSLSQVNTVGSPANCGRGTQVEWTSATAAQLPQTIVRTVSDSIEPNSIKEITVFCEPGEVVTGGGYHVGDIDANVWHSAPRSIYPSTVPIGWRAIGRSDNPSIGSGIDGYVVCMALPAP